MSGSGVEFRQYIRAITKRAWLIVLLAALAAGGMYMRLTSQTPRFAAETTLMVTAPVVQAPMSAVDGQGGGGGGGGRSPGNPFNDIIQLITSRPVGERVAKELGLAGPGEVTGRVSASQVRGTSLIKVRATSTDQTMAARLANTTADQLIAYFREINRRDMRDVRLFIEQQLTRVRGRLEESDRLVQAFKERHRIVDIGVTRSQVSSEVAAARAERDSTALAIRENEARLAASRARLANEQLEREMARTTRDNPVFSALQGRMTELEIQRAEAAQVYTPQHPRMKQLEGQITDLRQRMLAEAKTVLGEQTIGANPVHGQLLTQIVTLEVDRSALTAKQQALSFLERRRLAGLQSIPSLETGLTMLTRENTILENAYSMLSQRYQEAVLRENEAGFAPAGLQVMETATVPRAPVSARLPLQTAVAGLIGLLMGIMAAIFLETSDDRIRTSQDAEHVLGVPVLAEVPDMSTPKVAPAGAALLVALVLTMIAGGSVVAARTLGEGEQHRAPVSIIVRLGQSIDHLTARIGEAMR